MLTFANPGVIDPRAITTFGLNAKLNASPIGHFGTGLKYAIAIILRLGGTIKIETHDSGVMTTYDFTTAEASLRGKDFQFIHMEVSQLDEMPYSIPLAFTTELGKGWQAWQAYRELRSNMMDEGGSFDSHLPSPCTYILVECPEIEAAHAEAGNFFLLDSEPLWAGPDLEIHPSREDSPIFYRGIRVAAASAPGLYSYNILHSEALTEDRTLDLWTANYRIARALAELSDATLAEAILLAKPGTHEAGLSFDYVSEFSDEMREAIKLQKHNNALNSSARKRARILYSDDYSPKAVAATPDQRLKFAETMSLFRELEVDPGFFALRLCEADTDQDEFILSDGVLWIQPSGLESPDFLYHALSHVKFPTGKQWDSLRQEKFIAFLMRKILPSHPALAQTEEVHAETLDEEIPF